jgi:hypothetical protein
VRSTQRDLIAGLFQSSLGLYWASFSFI